MAFQSPCNRCVSLSRLHKRGVTPLRHSGDMGVCAWGFDQARAVFTAVVFLCPTPRRAPVSMPRCLIDIVVFAWAMQGVGIARKEESFSAAYGTEYYDRDAIAPHAEGTKVRVDGGVACCCQWLALAVWSLLHASWCRWASGWSAAAGGGVAEVDAPGVFALFRRSLLGLQENPIAILSNEHERYVGVSVEVRRLGSWLLRGVGRGAVAVVVRIGRYCGFPPPPIVLLPTHVLTFHTVDTRSLTIVAI